MTFCETPELMFRLMYRVLCDTPPSTANVGVLFGETLENEGVMLEAAARLWFDKAIAKLAVTGYQGQGAAAGFQSSSDELLDKLENLGVPRDGMVQYPLSTKLPPCTDAEALGFAEYAKERGWKTAIIIVPELHRFRTFVSLVSAVVKAKAGLKVWSYPTPPQPWGETVFFSQSAPRAPRRDLISSELEKVQRYCARGDHISAQEVLSYLDRRDIVCVHPNCPAPYDDAHGHCLRCGAMERGEDILSNLRHACST